MAGKKRKASSSFPGSRTTTTSAKGVDTLLTIRGRPLAVGASARFQLIKGPSATEASGDPADSTAPLEKFPLIAKFGESVVRPTFTKEPWHSARLYQQEIPKPVDDSDEDNDEGGEGGGANPVRKKRWRYGGGDTAAPRQWILQENVDFLQTMIDRKEQQQQQQKSNGGGAMGDENRNNCSGNTLSTRYEGIPEHNTSLFALVRLHPSTTSPQDATLQVCLLPSDRNCTINFAQPASRKTYSLTEAEHVISDQRMGLVKTLHHMDPTGSAAAPGSSGGNGGHAAGGEGDLNGTHASPGAGDGSGDAAASPPPPKPRPNILALRKKAAQSSKGRLLNRLQAKSKLSSAENEEEDGDDVMGDVTFRARKGGGGTARKELLQTMSGEGITVSDEGVLGGSNDAMFGGRQRFAQLAAGANGNDDAKRDRGDADGADAGADAEGAGNDGALAQRQGQERGADGAAMDDDFYQRDVQAEYEELDYDANEQFDDDDVDLGEGEVVVENTDGLDVSDELDEELEEEDEEDDGNQGAVGLASLAGFQALLAKARGETPPDAPAEGEPGATSEASTRAAQRDAWKQQQQMRNKKKSVDHMSKIMAAAEKSRLAAEQRQQRGSNNEDGMAGDAAAAMEEDNDNPAAQQAGDAANATSNSNRMGGPGGSGESPLVDARGLRIISLEAVRREIWLNYGSIPMKRLMKIFDVKKKSPQERQDQFRDILKELCTMKSDPINGRMLVLKQHYAK